MARASGIYLEISGQRFGSDLGKGATMLRSQLTGRTVHRVNDLETARMGLGDISDAELIATVVYMVNGGHVRLCGTFKGSRFDLASVSRA